MPVPTHRADCQTRLFPTKCPDCGDEVFYFSCTCGSRVFFDLSEPPWNPHEDRCIPYLLRYLVETGVPETQIRSIVEEGSQMSGIAIPPDVRRLLDELDRRTSNRLVIREVPAGSDAQRVSGVVISVNHDVNFMKRFKYTDNAIGRGLLGRLVRSIYVEVVIREDAREDYTCDQYCAFQELKAFSESYVTLHLRVAAELQPYHLPDGRSVWIIKRIEKLS